MFLSHAMWCLVHECRFIKIMWGSMHGASHAPFVIIMYTSCYFNPSETKAVDSLKNNVSLFSQLYYDRPEHEAMIFHKHSLIL